MDRLVYLATDDSTLWTKEIKPFQDKGYVFLGDSQICESFRYFSVIFGLKLDLNLSENGEYWAPVFNRFVAKHNSGYLAVK